MGTPSWFVVVTIVIAIWNFVGIPSIVKLLTDSKKREKDRADKKKEEQEKLNNRLTLFSKSIQTQLRRSLLEDYEKFKKRDSITIAEYELFEAQWDCYHNLGENGVMDQIHDEVQKMNKINS